MRVFTLSLVFIIGLGIYFMSNKNEKEILVHFPLKYVWDNPNLINPEKLDTVYEYYLLENLATGLVRDSSLTASGYEKSLVDTWEMVSDTQWKFHLSEDARWSNGTKIDAYQVKDHLVRLSKSNSLHLKQLKLIESIDIDQQWLNVSKRLILPWPYLSRLY